MKKKQETKKNQKKKEEGTEIKIKGKCKRTKKMLRS
jgi:hypothetical protein